MTLIGTHRSIATTLTVLCCGFAIWVNGIRADEKKAESANADAKTREVKLDDITLAVPESWKQQDVSGPFRVAQFEVPAIEGDGEPGELVVSFFEGSVGGVTANVNRWIGQFDAKDRKTKATEGTAKAGKYAIADITGTYNKPIGPPIRRQTKPMPGARMLSALVAVEGKGTYTLKLTGPEKTVTAAADAFRASFGADAKTEKELKLD
jgi:gluconolactonase